MSSFLNAAGRLAGVTISERIGAARRERRVLARVSRAAWRLEQAERERTWALVSARAEGISIRTLATAIGLSPSRVHQLVADADLDALDAALGELRAAGWPAPEDPDSNEDTDLDGRDHLADRLSDEVDWLRQCAGWLRQLDGGGYPPAVNLRPAADWPSRTWSSGPSAPARDCPPHQPCNWSGPGMPGRPSGTSAARSASGRATPTTRSGHADHPPPVPAFRKLDTVAVLTARLLPAPLYEWDGRTIKAHRADVRRYFGFRECSVPG